MRTIALMLAAVALLAAAAFAVFLPAESLGGVWAMIDRNSLVGFGALVEKEIDPDLWVGVAVPVLQWRAWAVALVVGILLGLAGRPWAPPSRRRRSRF